MSADPAWLAHLRHELRTPLNHAIGYSEMLLEDLDADAAVEPAAALRRVHAQARAVQALIHGRLGSARQEAEAPDLDALARELAPPLASMQADAAVLVRLPAPAGPQQWAGDLARIAGAIDALQQMTADRFASLPMRVAPPAPAPPAPSEAPRKGPTGLILVVDDDRDNRDLLVRWLARDGHRAIEAGGGREALRLLAEHDVDLVLLDMVMPDMNGLDVLAALRAGPPERRPPVLMISAYDETHSMVHCIEAGAEDYLPKPFERALMSARVGASLERKHLRDREARHLRELDQWNHALERRVAEQVALVERLGRLKRFFSPQLAELIVAGGADDPLLTHRREVTVCFLDLRGFTAFAETAEPEEVMAVLRDYHAEMGRLILAHEGTLERFTGDGMMVFFNDPVPVPNPGERVVRMAIEMRTSASRLVERWHRIGYELDLGIGIAQGFATIGAIGFEGRWDYGAIGSVTNLAARLCGEAKAGQTLMSQRVMAQTEPLVHARHVGDIALKGFHKPVPAFELIGLRD